MSMRRYAILVFAAGALCAQACSSSSPKTGTGGATGSGGSTATGGHGTGGTGVGGMIVGTGGATTDSGTDVPRDMAMDVPADAPRDTTVIDTAGTDADPAAVEKLACAAGADAGLMTSQPPFTAADFCTLYRQICTGIFGATVYATQNDCMTAYMGFNSDASTSEGINGQKGCRTYHLCNAYNGMSMGALNIHCPHATGFVVTNGDAGPGGPCP